MSRFEDQVRQWAKEIGAGYQGDVDDKSLDELTVGSWRMNVAYQLGQILEAEDIEPESLDLETLTRVYKETLHATVLARRTPTGDHTPLDLQFEHHGPARPGSGAVPPLPTTLANYFLAFDAQREQLVYAYSHDYHQFGHAWSYDGSSWSQLSDHSYRLGSCTQVWSGGYDPERGGVAGWSFDGDSPIGVVIAPDGLTVLSPPDSSSYGDEPARRIETGGELPEVKDDSEWDDLKGIFGIDRGRRVTVCLTELGVWELGADNAWKKCADVADGVLPAEAGGDRTYFGGGAAAVYDAKNERLVFWINDGDENDYWFFSWDGATLARLSADGLPDGVYSHFGEQAAVIGEDAEHGVVLFAGADKGLFTLADSGWIELEAGAQPPGASKASSLCSDPIRGLMMIGPGKYTASSYDEGGEQHAFYIRADGAWSRQGKVSGKSVLGEVRGSGGWPILGAAGGEAYAVGWRSNLHTARWSEGSGWSEIVSKSDGSAVFESGGGKGNRIALFEGPGERLHALAANGALFALDGETWTAVSKGPKGFGKRSEVQVAWDRQTDRIVVFGGTVKDRRSTDTFVFEAGSWKRIGEAATRPADYKFNYDNNGFDVDLELGYDTGLERVVRFGFTEVAVLDDENEWRVVPMSRYEELAHPDKRVTVHDPKTGETLQVNMVSKQISRFDVGGCDIIARWSGPDDSGDVEDHNKFPFRDRVFDAASRRLLIHNHDDRWGTFALDLGPAFDLAASISARTTELPPPPRPTVCLYKADGDALSIWMAEQVAADIVVQTGSLDSEPEQSSHAITEIDALEEAARASGFGPISSIPREVIEKRVLVPRWSLSFPDEGDVGVSRFGGRPSGIEEWPTEEDEPLGFLFQVELPEELGGGGVAVFCATDGSATEDPDYNRAIRLTSEQLAADEVAPPDGVPELTASPIEIGKRDIEIDDSSVAFLAERDASFAALIAEIADGCGDNEGFDKIGGKPSWLQSPDEELAILAAQVDFDGMTLESEDDGWEDAGLFGAIYVFVDPDSDETLAGWQYT